jgi:hypothetical protein
MIFRNIVKEVKEKTVGDPDGVYSAQFAEVAKRNAAKAITTKVNDAEILKQAI